jgi:hypothetical protein
MSGNILIITQPDCTAEDNSNKPTRTAYWLQRKIGKTGHGLLRLGYRLKVKDNTNGCWELDVDDGCRQRLVTVYMIRTSTLDNNKSSSSLCCHSPMDELSALQMIAQYNPTETAHVVGTDIVATSSQHVYAILPYHRDGNLLQFCQSVGCLEEPVARFVFQQIIQVRSYVMNSPL